MVVKTETSNLREFNRKHTVFETRFVGFVMQADGYKYRMYQDYYKGTDISVGDIYHIQFNCDEEGII